MFPHISIVINYFYRAFKLFLLVRTVICFIAYTLSDKDNLHPLLVLKPRYSKLSLAKKDSFALILKPAALSIFNTIFTPFRWSSKLPLLMINKSSML